MSGGAAFKGVGTLLALILLGSLFFLPGLKRLPVTDRDEARFAQASKQMIETGNFVDIRFQTKPRYKKPIGIYWLQAASAKLAGTSPQREIWPYRIPSFLGALFAMLLTFYFGSAFFDRKTAFLSSLLLGSCILLQVEARLATTDAVLLATIVAMQGALGKLYLASPEAQTWRTAMIFWIACGAGILVKGPVPVLIAALTIGTLFVLERNRRFIRQLHPLPGVGVLLAMVLPWFLAIHAASGGQFVRKAFLSDVLPKLLGGQESHGAPPGLYLVLFPVLFWPGSLLAFDGLVEGWRRFRKERPVKFLLAWIIPTWVVFELIPTKLPHYILPVFPAVALLTSYVFLKNGEKKPAERKGKLRIARMIYLWGCGIISFLLMIGIPGIVLYFHHRLSFAGVMAGISVPVVWYLLFVKTKKPNAWVLGVGCGIAACLVTGPVFRSVLPSLRPLWISRRVAVIVARQGKFPPPALASVGFHEPSLVFLLGTQTLLGEAPEAAEALRRHKVSYLLVTGREWPSLRRELIKRHISVKVIAKFRGVNYSKGRWRTLYLMKRAGP